MKKAYLTFLLGLSSIIGYSQISAPDTVCLNGNVTFSTPFVANSYAWSIGDINTEPSGISGSIVTKMTHPTSGISMQYDNGNYYGFVTNRNGGLIRLDFGTSPYNIPPTSVDLGDFSGALGDSTISLDIVKDNAGVWRGFTVDGKNLVTLNFGTSLANTPTATTTRFSNFFYPYFITVRRFNNEWVGFVINRGTSSITRLDYGTSLANTPSATDLSITFGTLSAPVNLAITQNDAGEYFALVTNIGAGGPGGDRLVRIAFGLNLKNNSPTAVNLNNPNNRLSNPRAIAIITECDSVHALVANENNNRLVKFEFAGNVISGNPSGVDIGTVGIPKSETNSFSSFWFNNVLHLLGSSFDSTIYMYTNVASVGTNGAAMYETPTFNKTISVGGTYDVTVHCNQGSPSGSRAFCRKIVVLGNIKVALKQDVDTLIASGTLCDNYVWKFNGVIIPGVNTQKYAPVEGYGVYTVTGSTAGCSATSSYMFWPTSISSVFTAKNVLISPNPSNGIFNIGINGYNGKIVVQCYNVMGAMVATKQVDINNSANFPIDISNMPKGVYQVKIHTDNGDNIIKQVLLQ